MAVIASFKALRITAFSDRPGGTNDPFVLSSFHPSDLLNVTIEDDDGTIAGDTISNEISNDPNQIATVTDNQGNPIATDVAYIEWTATYTGTNGQVIEVWRLELESGLRMFAVSEIPEPGVVFSTSNKDQGADEVTPADIPNTPCLTLGTLIATPDGPRLVEDLAVGDLVSLEDGSAVPLRWVGQRAYSPAALAAKPKLRPIRICSGALGAGLPARDMLVSRQHRMLVRSKIARRMFGSDEVLVAAIKLTALPGIFIDEAARQVTYFHLLFDAHQVIVAEGAPTESLYPGPEAMGTLDAEARDEVLAIFPELAHPDALPPPARPIPAGKKQKELVARHHKNAQLLLS
jgi:hypothetical protein